MKKTILSALLLTTFIAASQAQTVTEDSYSKLSLSFNTPDVVLDETSLGDNKYTTINLDGYIFDGIVGSPALPVLSNMVVVPFCSEMKVTVTNAVYDTLQATAATNWMPVQPSRSKSDRTPFKLSYNEDVYNTDAFVSMPLAQIEEIGIARDRRLARLAFAPVSVNPVTGQYIVCRKADVTVTYVNADSAATEEHFQRYYTPAFSFGQTINSLVNTKAVRTDAPPRMVIVCPISLSSTSVTKFVNWKKRQGYIVDRITYGIDGIESNTALANKLKSLYTDATTEAPAPTYLMLIGDNEQVPAFNGTVNNTEYAHVSDLYYVTWTSGDVIPDCYQGRISATSKNAVSSILDKILMYEKYEFPDDSYLEKSVLVSGVDDDDPYAYPNFQDQTTQYCDPNLDYAVRYYINSNNGYNTVYYFKNKTNIVPENIDTVYDSRASNAATQIKNFYHEGAGWVNYSGHGFTDSWYKPAFSVSDASGLRNNDKPMFVVANCCLTNFFNQSTCLGEAFLRRGNNAGAVAYIGGTNSTYWKEDFYWSVGLRNGINYNMNATYNSGKLGVYDRLFHTHSEAFSDYAITAGAMPFFGCMAVQNATSTYLSGDAATTKKYYWEIYELMGDPSMMPWLGRAQELTNFSVQSQQNDDGTYTITIYTVPRSYVAMRDTVGNTILGAAFVAGNGRVVFTVDDADQLSNALISVVAQGYKPFFYHNANLGIKNAADASAVNIYPNPATSQCTVAATGMQSARLLDSRGSLVALYAPVDGTCSIDLQSLPRGIYFVQVQTPGSLTAKKLIVK